MRLPNVTPVREAVEAAIIKRLVSTGKCTARILTDGVLPSDDKVEFQPGKRFTVVTELSEDEIKLLSVDGVFPSKLARRREFTFEVVVRVIDVVD